MSGLAASTISTMENITKRKASSTPAHSRKSNSVDKENTAFRGKRGRPKKAQSTAIPCESQKDKDIEMKINLAESISVATHTPHTGASIDETDYD